MIITLNARRNFLKAIPFAVLGAISVLLLRFTNKGVGNTSRPPEVDEESIYAPAKRDYEL